MRGSTSHYEAVVNAATSGVLNAGMTTGVPVIFGVLTTEDMEQVTAVLLLSRLPIASGRQTDERGVQALDRAGGKAGNKGFECAVTAIEMADLMRQLKADGKAA